MNQEHIRYIKYLVILLVNIFLIYCAIDACFFQPQSDTNGYFVIMMIFVMILYNLYAGFTTYISKLISEKYKYTISTLFCLFPFCLIIYGCLF